MNNLQFKGQVSITYTNGLLLTYFNGLNGHSFAKLYDRGLNKCNTENRYILPWYSCQFCLSVYSIERTHLGEKYNGCKCEYWSKYAEHVHINSLNYSVFMECQR